MAIQTGYKREFRHLIEHVADSTYIGEGNPNSSILIIGKECAIDDLELENKIAANEIGREYALHNLSGEERYRKKERAIADLNLSRWRRLIEASISPTELESRIKQTVHYTNSYYPFFPHRGQKYQQRKQGGKIGEHGTAPTWYFYQSLVDLIKAPNKTKTKEDLIDFHLNSFHTEMSQIPLPMSNQIKNLSCLRTKSIEKRSKLFREPFFRQFPIVILAAGHYPRDNSFDIEAVFNVNFEYSKVSGNSWYNIHRQKSGVPRLLIHTRQFSMISNQLVSDLADECRIFIEGNKIEL